MTTPRGSLYLWLPDVEFVFSEYESELRDSNSSYIQMLRLCGIEKGGSFSYLCSNRL